MKHILDPLFRVSAAANRKGFAENIGDIRQLMANGNGVYPPDLVNLSDADLKEALLNLDTREAFLKDIERLQTPHECELTGMPIETLSYDEAVAYAIQDWRHHFKMSVENSSPRSAFGPGFGQSLLK